jgi:hypothetical protein
MSKSVVVRPEVPGQVSENEVYTLEELQQRLKLGQHALRMARRAGLKVRRIGRRGYVLGRDIMQFIESIGK